MSGAECDVVMASYAEGVRDGRKKALEGAKPKIVKAYGEWMEAAGVDRQNWEAVVSSLAERIIAELEK